MTTRTHQSLKKNINKNYSQTMSKRRTSQTEKIIASAPQLLKQFFNDYVMTSQQSLQEFERLLNIRKLELQVMHLRINRSN